MFELKNSLHGQPSLEKKLNPEQYKIVKRCITANHADDPAYQKKSKAHPFLQGCDSRSGWVLIEFWTTDQNAINEYVDFLNKEVFSTTKLL